MSAHLWRQSLALCGRLPLARTTYNALPPSLRSKTYFASRTFTASPQPQHVTRCPKGEGFRVNYITPQGDRIAVRGREGENLLEIAHANGIDLEGACECSLACSTCHVIVDDKFYDMLEEPSDDENDMLDLAFGLTDTSRLGCQVTMCKELDGLTVTLPSATRNVQSSKLK